MSDKKKKKLDFRYLLVEALLIVFTVSLALALNEWRANVKANEIRDKAHGNILREIKSNKKDLENKLDYHNKSVMRISSYLASDSLLNTVEGKPVTEVLMMLMPQGILQPELQSGAWNSAVLSGVINSFDYEVLYTLSDLYQTQEDGPNSTWKTMAAIFFEPDTFDSKNIKQLLFRMQLGFGELYSQEKSLLIDFDKAIKEMEE